MIAILGLKLQANFNCLEICDSFATFCFDSNTASEGKVSLFISLHACRISAHITFTCAYAYIVLVFIYWCMTKCKM